MPIPSIVSSVAYVVTKMPNQAKNKTSSSVPPSHGGARPKVPKGPGGSSSSTKKASPPKGQNKNQNQKQKSPSQGAIKTEPRVNTRKSPSGFRIGASLARREAALWNHSLGMNGFFQVQGQYLHVRTTVYRDYVSDGNSIICNQLVIDPQDTFPIFGSTSTEVIGADPVHVQCHILQPNVLTPFSSSSTQLDYTADKALLVLSSIPLQYATGTGGTGFRQFGWNKCSTQITPSNEPAWINVFDFHAKQLPHGAVWDVSDSDSNMVLGAIRVVNVDNFSQATCTLQTRWSFEVRIPLPNLNTAKWNILKVPGSSGLDKIGDVVPLSYTTALTEITSLQRDKGGNAIQQAMRMAELDEADDQVAQLAAGFEDLGV